MAREILVTLAAFQDREPAPMLYDLWARELSDIPPALLRAAGDRLLKTWRSGFLPMPADVRAQIDDAERKALALSAEAEWQRALRFATRGWHPDIGYVSGAKHSDLSPISWHALRAAGGLTYVNGCASDELVWAKKRFIEAFTLAHDAQKVQHLIGDGEAAQILARIGGGNMAEKKALGAPGLKTAQVLRAADSPGLETAQVGDAVGRLERRLRRSASALAIELSEGEIRRRAEDGKKRLAEWAAEHDMSL